MSADSPPGVTAAGDAGAEAATSGEPAASGDERAVSIERLRWWHIEDVLPIEEDLFGVEKWSAAMFWNELATGQFYLVALAGEGADGEGVSRGSAEGAGVSQGSAEGAGTSPKNAEGSSGSSNSADGAGVSLESPGGASSKLESAGAVGADGRSGGGTAGGVTDVGGAAGGGAAGGGTDGGGAAGVGRVVGYAGLSVVDASESWVQNIAVRRDAQRLGLGRRLLEALLAEAARRGVRKTLLEVAVDNEPAQRLYASYDFQPVGIRRGYYQPSNTDALVMMRNV